MGECDRCEERLTRVHEPIVSIPPVTDAPHETVFADGLTLCWLCVNSLDEKIKAHEGGPVAISEESRKDSIEKHNDA